MARVRSVVGWALLFFATSAYATDVSFQTANVSSADTGAATAATLTWAHTVAAGTNLALFVGCTAECSANCASGATATFNGDAMTEIGVRSVAATTSIYAFALANPDVATGNIVFDTETGNQAMTCGAITAVNVDQTTPAGTLVMAGSFTTSQSCTAMVPFRGAGIGIGGKINSTEGIVTATQTERWNDQTTIATAASNRLVAGATATTSGSTTYTFTSASARSMGCIAIPVRGDIARRVPLGGHVLLSK